MDRCDRTSPSSDRGSLSPDRKLRKFSGSSPSSFSDTDVLVAASSADLLREGKLFVYETDFDTNGILYWLGTNGKSTPYTNPSFNDIVTVTPSSIAGGTPQGFIEHTHREAYCCTNSCLGSSVKIELPSTVIVTRYSVRSDKHKGCKLRNWLLEGSKDGREWVELSRHENDTSLAESPGSTATWRTNPKNIECSQFRLVQIGPNSSDGLHLMCAGLELYGCVQPPSPQTKPVRSHMSTESTIDKPNDSQSVSSADSTLNDEGLQTTSASCNTRTCDVSADSLVHVETAEASVAFHSRIIADGICNLNEAEVSHLMHELGCDIPKSVVAHHQFSGKVLQGLTETEMLTVLHITTLGARRRLSIALKRLQNHEGFKSCKRFDWSVDQVCQWMIDHEASQISSACRSNEVDGEVLLSLTRDDLESLGMSNLFEKVKLLDAIEALKHEILDNKNC